MVLFVSQSSTKFVEVGDVLCYSVSLLSSLTDGCCCVRILQERVNQIGLYQRLCLHLITASWLNKQYM